MKNCGSLNYTKYEKFEKKNETFSYIKQENFNKCSYKVNFNYFENFFKKNFFIKKISEFYGAFYAFMLRTYKHTSSW